MFDRFIFLYFPYVDLTQELFLTQSITSLLKKTTTLERNMSKFVVSTVHADGLAPLGARPSAGTVIMKFGPVFIWNLHWKS